MFKRQQTTSYSAAFLNQDILQKRAGGYILLLITAAFLFVNFLALSIIRNDLIYWSHYLVWLICAFGGKYLLDRYQPAHDPLLFVIAIFLSGWGLVIINRLAPGFANRQIIWLIMSIIAMLFVALFPHPLRWLRSYRYSLLLMGLLLLISTMALGQNPSGQLDAPQLWLGIGNVFFQPSEVLKVILVAFLASYLAEQHPVIRAEIIHAGVTRPRLSPRIFGPIFLMWGISIVILVWQRDLGTAILFFTIFIVLLYIASSNLIILASGAVLIVIAGIVAYNLFSVVQLRVDVWLNPWPEANNRAFQIVQSLMAFSAGGIFGQGVGQGTPTFIPVAHSDFVFAALGEEWGLSGVIVVIVCIATLVMRGFRAGIKWQNQPFRVLLAVGLSATLGIQSALIMGGVLKLIPLTGLTLPFLSYGGSSLLMTFIAIGLLTRLSSREG